MTSDEKQIKGSVMVIGGGITGIQASLDIAEQGFKVYLVETTPSIGGRMAQLDKTFPTNDCSICIEAPKMVEVLRHPNIELKTYHEVLKVEGEVGNFNVRLLKKPRYVVDDKCNGCGKCVEACLITASNEFELGLGLRKAIYIPFPQAVPNVAVLDPLCRDTTYYKMYGFKACVGTCTIDCAVCKTCPVARCMIACKEEGRDAIELWQRARKKRIYVGSIIVATGYDLLEPTMKKEYGYGIYKNVLTSLQYERLICASGPTSGEITRLSDGKYAHKIAWIQCVGSRDKKTGIPYCCRVGCMYATKEAIITKEHDPSIETYIFYQDLKAYAKRFEGYMKRAKELGIRYVRSRVASVSEDPESNDLIIAYENVDTGTIEELRVDIVNLTPAFIPSKGNKELAEILGIELNEFGFFKERDPLNAPLETTVPGIYLAGCCTGPKDIPESISTGGAAATKAIIPITEARNTEISQVEYPPEIEVKPTDEPRIGVFVCDCGHNIAGVVNVAEVAEYAKPFRNVIHSEEGQYLCSADYQEVIKQVIKEENLNRVVVACCTPRTHEPLFRVTLREAGLNPYLLEFTNIREHCSWVHMNEPENATKKAKDLVRMGIAKARHLEPQDEFTLPVGNTCLVVGGGIAGMSAALALAGMNFKVKLIEKDEELGGMLRKLNSLFPHDNAPEDIINPLIEDVKGNENIDTYTNTKIRNIDGFIGNFLVTITDKNNEEEKEFKADTIIVATGIKEMDPIRYYHYGIDDRVITQLQLEEKLKNGQFNGGKNVVIINCVGARDPNSNPHCCRVGCGVSLKNATHIKKLYPDTNVYILYRDLMTEDVDRDKAVIDNGVTLIRYKESRKPEVYKDDDKLLVKVYDLRLAEEIEIEADSIVLTMAIEGNDTEELRAMLRVTMGTANFFEEAHVKLRPLEFATDGIYLCGGAHSSQTVEETIAQAIGVASKASIPMSKGLAKSEGITSLVDTEKCIGCGICVSVCPYDAIRIEDHVANVIEVKCKGCGCCGSSCIERAITMRGFTDEQLMLQARAALIAEEPRPKEVKAVVTE